MLGGRYSSCFEQVGWFAASAPGTVASIQPHPHTLFQCMNTERNTHHRVAGSLGRYVAGLPGCPLYPVNTVLGADAVD